MSRCFVALVLVVIIPLSGCHMSTRPRVVAEVAAGSAAKVSVRPAPYDGEYRLYAAGRGEGPWPEPVGEPLATHRLRRDDPVGFRRDDGALSAVAGDQVIALEQSGVGYLWQMRADPGQLDRNKAVILAGVALALAFGFAGATVAAAPL